MAFSSDPRLREGETDAGVIAQREQRHQATFLSTIGWTLAMSLITAIITIALTWGHFDQQLTDLQKQEIPNHFSTIDKQIAELEGGLKLEAALRQKDEEQIDHLNEQLRNDIVDIKSGIRNIDEKIDRKVDKPGR